MDFQKEKELSDAKIDLRIAQREAKTAEDQLKSLQEEKDKWAEKLLTEKTAHADQLLVEHGKVEALQGQVAALETQLQDAKWSEEAARKQVEVNHNTIKDLGLLAQSDLIVIQ